MGCCGKDRVRRVAERRVDEGEAVVLAHEVRVDEAKLRQLHERRRELPHLHERTSVALPARCSNASSNRSRGTRSETNCSSTSCQRSHARSSASTPATQSCLCAFTLPKSTRLPRIVSSATVRPATS